VGKSVSGFVEMMLEKAENVLLFNPVEQAGIHRRRLLERDQGFGL